MHMPPYYFHSRLLCIGGEGRDEEREGGGRREIRDRNKGYIIYKRGRKVEGKAQIPDILRLNEVMDRDESSRFSMWSSSPIISSHPNRPTPPSFLSISPLCMYKVNYMYII